MSEIRIEFPDGVTNFFPGEQIEVNVSWALALMPTQIEVRLVWNTSGKGTQDLKVVKTVHIEDPDQAGEQTIPLELPWGPYSFSGKLISLTWAIEVVAYPTRRSTRSEILVAPNREEVVLESKTVRGKFEVQ